MKREQEFKRAAESALASVCFRDEHGNFYTEIYADYRDELEGDSLKKLCNAEKISARRFSFETAEGQGCQDLDL